jgi:tRNA A37 methylthiotransferase MiaB
MVIAFIINGALSSIMKSVRSMIPSSEDAHTAYVTCNGCPESRIDSARVRKHLEENGWKITDRYQDADMILFQSCALTQEKATVSLNIIKEIQRKKKKGSKLVVWGCLSKIDPETLSRVYQGLTFAETEFPQLDKIIGSTPSIEKTSANDLIPKWPLGESIGKGVLIRYEGSPFTRALRSLAVRYENLIDSKINIIRKNDPSFFYIKIATGCLSICSYCGVHKSRGNVKSKPVKTIMEEFREGLQKGFKNFGLLGTDLGAYGKDLGYTLVDLLKEIVEIEGDFRIGLRNINPSHLKSMLTELGQVLESNKVWYIECPAESGSNRILRLMNRNYTIEEYKNCIREIRIACPKIVIRTQLMVGFPTETDQDFEETMCLLDDGLFDVAEVYKYSMRPGTPAARMTQIPEQTKRQRYLKLYRKALLNRTFRKISLLISISLRQRRGARPAPASN